MITLYNYTGTLTLERIEELSHIQASSLLNDVPTSMHVNIMI